MKCEPKIRESNADPVRVRRCHGGTKVNRKPRRRQRYDITRASRDTGSQVVAKLGSVLFPVVIGVEDMSLLRLLPTFFVLFCRDHIQPAIDNAKCLGINIGIFAERHPCGTIATKFRRITIRIGGKQVAVGGAGEVPTRVFPDVFELTLAFRRLAVREPISSTATTSCFSVCPMSSSPVCSSDSAGSRSGRTWPPTTSTSTRTMTRARWRETYR